MDRDLSHSVVASRALKRSARVCWTFAALAACTGCWEEIRYQGHAATQDTEPSAVEPDAGDATDAPQQQLVAPAASIPPGPEEGGPAVLPPTDDAANPTAGPTAGDLFGDEALLGEVPAGADGSPRIADPAPPADAAAAGDPFVAPTPQAADPPPSPAERRTAWRAASDWALAVAVAAKGYASDHYTTYLVDAERAATTIDVTLPALPAATDGESENLNASIVELLAGEGGNQLATNIAERLDSQAGAAARLAVQAHLLLLTYLPSNPNLADAASAISAAGWEAQLPMELWQPLVQLVEQRADFLDVRAAVFTLRDAVSKYYAEQAGY